jgi:hypothetical protein
VAFKHANLRQRDNAYVGAIAVRLPLCAKARELQSS